jgi:DNA-directed RNA polymerase specialized sigma24 family protein
MSAAGSVTYWIGRLKAGDHDKPSRRLWDAYAAPVVRVALARLAGLPRLRSEAEDVALSALDSFFRRAAAGRFPRLDDRHDLWAVLLTLTCRKAARLVRRASGGPQVYRFTDLQSKEAGRDDPPVEAAAPDPDPVAAAAVADGVARLLGVLSGELRTVALLALAGHTNREIGARLDLSEGSIGRKLRLIRETWRAEFSDEVPGDKGAGSV